MRGAADPPSPIGTSRPPVKITLPVRADVDRRVTAEHLEPLMALVDVDVRDPGPGGRVAAHHEDVRDVRARHPELVRVRVEVVTRDVARIRGSGRRRGERAGGNEDRNGSTRLERHGASPLALYVS